MFSRKPREKNPRFYDVAGSLVSPQYVQGETFHMPSFVPIMLELLHDLRWWYRGPAKINEPSTRQVYSRRQQAHFVAMVSFPTPVARVHHHYTPVDIQRFVSVDGSSTMGGICSADPMYGQAVKTGYANLHCLPAVPGVPGAGRMYGLMYNEPVQ
jgi:hypothetical protein